MRIARNCSMAMLAFSLFIGAGRSAGQEVISALSRPSLVAASGRFVAFSDYDPSSRSYRLIVSDGRQRWRVPVPTQRKPFEVALGPARTTQRTDGVVSVCRPDCTLWFFNVDRLAAGQGGPSRRLFAGRTPAVFRGRVAYSTTTGAIYVRDLDGTRRQQISPGAGLPRSASVDGLAVDDRWLAAVWTDIRVGDCGAGDTAPVDEFRSVIGVSSRLRTFGDEIVGCTATRLQEVVAPPFLHDGAVYGLEVTARFDATQNTVARSTVLVRFGQRTRKLQVAVLSPVLPSTAITAAAVSASGRLYVVRRTPSGGYVLERRPFPAFDSFPDAAAAVSPVAALSAIRS